MSFKVIVHKPKVESNLENVRLHATEIYKDLATRMYAILSEIELNNTDHIDDWERIVADMKVASEMEY